MDELYCEIPGCGAELSRPRTGPPPRLCKVCLRRPPNRRRPLAQLDALLERQRSQGLWVPPPRSRYLRSGTRV